MNYMSHFCIFGHFRMRGVLALCIRWARYLWRTLCQSTLMSTSIQRFCIFGHFRMPGAGLPYA
jgi:hypothetical protein